MRDDKQLVLLEYGGSKIGLPEEGFAASGLILDVSQDAGKQLYSGDMLIRTPSQQELASTLKCLMVKKGAYV